MESALCAVLLVGLLFAPGSYGQDVTGTTVGSSSLQPWVVGLAAVVGFLGLIFVLSLVNRIFFASKTKDVEEARAETDVELSSQRPRNVYENLALDAAEEGAPAEAQAKGEKLTSM